MYEWLTSPSFDAAFFDAEHEDCPTLNHCPAFRVVEAASDAWNDTLPCGVYQP